MNREIFRIRHTYEKPVLLVDISVFAYVRVEDLQTKKKDRLFAKIGHLFLNLRSTKTN